MLKQSGRSLDAEARDGETPADAAGVERWLVHAQQDLGILSRQTRDEINAVVDQWLAEKVSSDKLTMYRMVAQTYADFLAERVNFKELDAIWQLDQARREWKERKRS
jgi:hypothetical protein